MPSPVDIRAVVAERLPEGPPDHNRPAVHGDDSLVDIPRMIDRALVVPLIRRGVVSVDMDLVSRWAVLRGVGFAHEISHPVGWVRSHTQDVELFVTRVEIRTD